MPSFYDECIRGSKAQLGSPTNSSFADGKASKSHPATSPYLPTFFSFGQLQGSVLPSRQSSLRVWNCESYDTDDRDFRSRFSYGLVGFLALSLWIGTVFYFASDSTSWYQTSPLAQFAAIVALVVNWASTIVIYVLTCECLIVRDDLMMSHSDLLGVTLTALFALPSIRMLLPGSPELGCLMDLIGIIPQLIIVALCTITITIIKLKTKL